jgi:tetratricopeptide (TPR) repeat protein
MERPKRQIKRWWLRERDEVIWSLERWPLLRHLIVEPRFRFAWIAVLAFVVFLAASVPRVWITSPPGMVPVVRVSFIDLIEARLYRNLALRAESDDRPQRAFEFWRTALHNNPTDLDVVRGSISNTLLLPRRNSGYFGTAVRNSLWLLQLTRTNRSDLDFALRVYERFGIDELLLHTLAHVSPLTVEEMEIGCRALIRMGNGPQYREIRAQLPKSAEGSVFQLYDAAFDAAWSEDSATRADGLARLERARTSVEPARLPDLLNLFLVAYAATTNTAGYGATLDRLRDLHRDDPLQHARYWKMLAASGRRDDAITLARKYSDPPINTAEVLRISETFLLLGLVDDAVSYLEKFAPEVGVSGDVWIALTDLLISEKRWPDLRRVATEMRMHDGARSLLGGYTYYLEGLALRAEGGDQDASQAFDLVPSGNIRDSELALRVATKLTELGAPKPARRLLEQIQRAHVSNSAFWAQFVRVAHVLRDAPLMLDAAEKGYKAAPSDPSTVNNLVAALIINRADPERLLGLAAHLFGIYPNELPVKVNYSLALILNGRPDDALPILGSITNAEPDRVEGTMLAFAKAEAFALKGDIPAATTNALAVNTSFLLPAQAERIEALLARGAEQPDSAPLDKGK